MPTRIERLLIVSHVVHYRHQGAIYAYGPYTREIDIWADLFAEVRIASPVRDEEPPGDCLPFQRSNISVAPQMETGGDRLIAKLQQMALLPVHLCKLGSAMRTAQAIHVRCPGNLGLLGLMLAPIFSRNLVAKYAGQWNGYQHEPLSVRMQRALMRSFWWRRGIVTVYGQWPDQPRQIVPFFTSMMTADQVRRSAEVARHKCLASPVEILYSGRLAELKGVDVLLRAAGRLARDGVPFRLSIVGEGPEAPRLKQLAADLGIQDSVLFTGAVPYQEVMQWYEKAHVLVLPSRHSEGWPKVLAEAMCHGLVCISTDHGLIPWLLRGRGYVFPVDDADALVACLKQAISDPDEYLRLSKTAASWAQAYSLEGLREALQDLLSRKWQCPLPVTTHPIESAR